MLTRLAVGVSAVVVGISILFWSGLTGGSDHKHHAPKDATDLAARVNTACPEHYALSDWTTGDEYTPVPEGTVKVTCVNTRRPYDLKFVAVAR